MTNFLRDNYLDIHRSRPATAEHLVGLAGTGAASGAAVGQFEAAGGGLARDVLVPESLAGEEAVS